MTKSFVESNLKIEAWATNYRLVDKLSFKTNRKPKQKITPKTLVLFVL